MMEGGESKYLDVPDARVNEVVAFFPSEGDSPEKFKTFTSTIEAQFAGQCNESVMKTSGFAPIT